MSYKLEIAFRILFTQFTDCISSRKHDIPSPRASISLALPSTSLEMTSD